MGAPAKAHDERIVEAATALFARDGYAAVSMRDVAAAVDRNIATVHHHVGRKADLYLAVFERLYRKERAVLEAGTAVLTDDVLDDPVAVRRALHDLLDAYLDFLVAEPAVAPLWIRRWVDSADELEPLWRRYAEPQFDLIETKLARAAAFGSIAPLDIRWLVRTIVWATHGYLAGALPEPEGIADPRDPDRLASFRTFLHQLADLALVGGGSGDVDGI